MGVQGCGGVGMVVCGGSVCGGVGGGGGWCGWCVGGLPKQDSGLFIGLLQGRLIGVSSVDKVVVRPNCASTPSVGKH